MIFLEKHELYLFEFNLRKKFGLKNDDVIMMMSTKARNKAGHENYYVSHFVTVLCF